jgi:hypothetical protein
MTTTPTVNDAALVDDLTTSVGQMLAKLDNLYPFVRALVNSHQEPYVSFLLPEQLDNQNRSYRADRFARDLAASAGHQLPGRESPAPGNLGAISIDALLHYTLHAVIKAMRNNLRARSHHHLITTDTGVYKETCTSYPLCRECQGLDVTRTPAEPTFDQLLTTARLLSWQMTTLGALNHVLRELEDVHTQALDLIDGNARVLLAEVYEGVVCPHCQRATLAAFFRDDLIRCDRDPDTGKWEPCICHDLFCECKHRPIEFRHDWIRSKPGRDKRSWYALSDLLGLGDLKVRAR